MAVPIEKIPFQGAIEPIGGTNAEITDDTKPAGSWGPKKREPNSWNSKEIGLLSTLFFPKVFIKKHKKVVACTFLMVLIFLIFLVQLTVVEIRWRFFLCRTHFFQRKIAPVASGLHFLLDHFGQYRRQQYWSFRICAGHSKTASQSAELVMFFQMFFWVRLFVHHFIH